MRIFGAGPGPLVGGRRRETVKICRGAGEPGNTLRHLDEETSGRETGRSLAKEQSLDPSSEQITIRTTRAHLDHKTRCHRLSDGRVVG